MYVKLLYAVDPGDKLKCRAGRRVALDVRLWSTVYCIEHHKAVLCASILVKKETKELI